MNDYRVVLEQNYLSTKKKNNALIWSLSTLLLCLVMSQAYWSNYMGLGELLAASPSKVFENGEYYRLFTTSFIHGDFAHFLSNSVMLCLMGYFVSYNYGAVSYPIMGFIAGIIINLIVVDGFLYDTTLVGASGVVHYLWGFWFTLYILIERHIPLHRRFMKVTAVGIFILAPTEFKPQVSYHAHGVGLILGLLTGIPYYFINKKRILSFEKWRIVKEIVDEELEYEALNAVTSEQEKNTVPLAERFSSSTSKLV